MPDETSTVVDIVTTIAGLGDEAFVKVLIFAGAIGGWYMLRHQTKDKESIIEGRHKDNQTRISKLEEKEKITQQEKQNCFDEIKAVTVKLEETTVKFEDCVKRMYDANKSTK